MRTRWLAVVVAAVALAGCTPQPVPPTAPEATSRPNPAPSTTSLPPTPPPPPPPEVSYGPGATATPSSQPTAPEPSAAPPNQPAPTANGPLTERSLPNPVGEFRGRPAQPTEGEFNPNGTWVYAVAGPTASAQALPQCGSEALPPLATHALAGAYANPAGVPGNGLALEFATDADAAAWFGSFTRRLSTCGASDPISVRDLAVTGQSFTARRVMAPENTPWSEAGRVRGRSVVLVLVGGLDHDLRTLAAAVNGV